MSGRFSFSSLLSLSTRRSIAMPIWTMRGKWARICKTGQMNAWMKFIIARHNKLKQQCRFTVSGAHRCSHKLKIQKHLYINMTHWISVGQRNTVAIYKEKGVWCGVGWGWGIQMHTNHHIFHQTIIPILQPQNKKRPHTPWWERWGRSWSGWSCLTPNRQWWPETRGKL